jgi:serine/threonine-protein kinase
VDALARTEVGAMIGAASLRTRPGDSNIRPSFQPFAIGAYECVEQLGEGAMGIVYKARHEKLDRWCAVKVLVPDLAEKPDAAMQFRREAKLAASVQHPNTVVVYDFGELDGGLLYLVMELLEGRSMDAVLRERRLAAQEALELTRQLCAGLDALHAAGIVHQDLKPQNVMVIDRNTAAPVVKIVDFGLARLAGADPIESPSGGRRISGTPLYMAPEQARADERITASADLFSLAVVAYELLAGTAPFEVEGRTVSQVVLERASGQYRPRTIAFAVGEASKARALDALFAEALAVEPERRPPSAQVFFSRMQGALAA